MNVSTNWAKEKHKEGVNGINYIPKGKGKKQLDFIDLILAQMLYQIENIGETINPRVRRATYHQVFKH